MVFPSVDGILRVEFFQGEGHGPLVAISQEVCLNSPACALTGALDRSMAAETDLVALMGGEHFLYRLD